MKKQTKNILEDLFLCLMSIFLLICGCLAKEKGQEGIGLFMIMVSLYIVLWIHAGLVGTIIASKLKEQDKENN